MFTIVYNCSCSRKGDKRKVGDTTKEDMARKSKEQLQREAQYKRQNLWNSEKTKNYHLKLSKDKHGDIIAFLDSKANKNGYLISLIENDMRHN